MIADSNQTIVRVLDATGVLTVANPKWEMGNSDTGSETEKQKRKRIRFGAE
jgi:hypothetical protein